MPENITSKKSTYDQITNQIHVLIVDDQVENINSMTTVLESPGRLFFTAENGSQAFKILLQEKIDIVLLDIRMPEISGFEVARLIRTNKKTRNIPIIFVTAATPEELEPVLQFDPETFDIVHKPVDLYAITNALETMEEKIRRKDMNSTNKQVETLENEIKDLLYLLAHDMNAPLRAIEQISGWIEEELPDNVPDSVKENFTLLTGRVKRMQYMLKGLVAYNKVLIPDIKNENIDLNEFLHFVSGSVTLPDGAEIRINTQNRIIEGDKTALYYILTELINNSVKHHPTGKNMLIELGIVEENQRLFFYVADNGKGIKPELHKQVFRIFQTLRPKDEFETTGAGLTICKKLIDQRNGEIKIQDSILGGAMFKFRLG